MIKPPFSTTLDEDAEALRAYDQAMAKLANGEEELLPAPMIDRLLNGENPIRVWREHRGLTVEELAEKAEISVSEIVEIESGEREGGVDTLRSIAKAIGIKVDNLA